jgi:hypothetical protein
MVWRKSRDYHFRGDGSDGCSHPDPRARVSIVAHVLYLGGMGRPTPYQSTSESEETAKHFAGRAGRVYQTSASTVKSRGVDHIERLELLRLLRGKGHGKAKWPSALEVMNARRLVELWAEHLLDFSDVPPADVPNVVKGIYK